MYQYSIYKDPFWPLIVLPFCNALLSIITNHEHQPTSNLSACFLRPSSLIRSRDEITVLRKSNFIHRPVLDAPCDFYCLLKGSIKPNNCCFKYSLSRRKIRRETLFVYLLFYFFTNKLKYQLSTLKHHSIWFFKISTSILTGMPNYP